MKKNGKTIFLALFICLLAMKCIKNIEETSNYKVSIHTFDRFVDLLYFHKMSEYYEIILKH